MLLGVVTALAAGLRLYELAKQPLWLDEATTAHFAERSLVGTFFAESVHPPLFNLLEHGVIRLFGASEIALRMPSVVFGILAVPAAWSLARRLFPQQRDAAPAAAALVATSPFLVYLSQEARNYALLILLALMSTVVFLRFCEGQPKKEGRADDLTVYALLSVLMLYTHYFAAWVLLAHEAAYWLHRRARMREWVRARVYAGLAFLPWALFVFEDVKVHVLDWVGDVKWRLASALLRDLVGYGIAAPNIIRREEPVSKLLSEEGYAVAFVALPLLALMLLGAWRLRVERAGGEERGVDKRARILFAAILVAPIVVMVAVSPWVRLLHERAVSFQAPFLLLLAAFGWATLPRMKRILAGATVACGIAFALAAYYGSPGELFGYKLQYGREDWRGAAAYVEQVKPDAVVLAPGYLRLAFERYWRVPRETVALIEVPPTEERVRWGLEALQRLTGARRIALVVSHSGPAEERLREEFDRTWQRTPEEKYFSYHSGIRVYVYERRAEVQAP